MVLYGWFTKQIPIVLDFIITFYGGFLQVTRIVTSHSDFSVMIVRSRAYSTVIALRNAPLVQLDSLAAFRNKLTAL